MKAIGTFERSFPLIASKSKTDFPAAQLFASVVLIGHLLTLPAAAQGPEPQIYEPVAPQVLEPGAMRALGAEAAPPEWTEGDPVRTVEDLREEVGPTPPVDAPDVLRAFAPTTTIPVPGINIDGIGATGVLPPDTVGDVGPNHYIQMVNSAFSIYDKSGNLLVGPTLINQLWAEFGGPCETLNNGDPIVRYDHLADRWLMSQFALPGGDAGFFECIAISRTGDPVGGGWFLYAFPTLDGATGAPVFPDYPKIGVWGDAYYMGTQRGFPNGGLDVWAFEREQMLNGAPAQVVQFSVPAPSLFLMPSDLDGPPPPEGTPNFFLRHVDGERFGGNDRLEVFAFSVDWANPAGSSFLQVGSLATDPFDSVLCSATLLGACVPQPDVPQRLESLTVWPMWRLQFRNMGTHEAMVTNHTVDANARDLAGIRWYELRRGPGGNWAIFQQGTYAPDDVHRWMGSVAMDRSGNIALGYSASNRTVYPSIRHTGRLVSDPPGVLSQPETVIIAGSGSQTHGSSRYGNYSSMDVDPVDDCTFWYTTEYYSDTSTAGWRTRIASFRNPECSAPDQPARFAYEYVAKLVCGLQPDPRNMQLVRGFYGSAINIRNAGDQTVSIRKSLALTFPPKPERPGEVVRIATHEIPRGRALEVDCEDVRDEGFDGEFPTRYIKGFIVVESTGELNVTAVYTSAGLRKDDQVTSVTSVDVEDVLASAEPDRDSQQCPDLTVQSVGQPSVDCPTGGGSCVTTVQYTVANIGAGDSGPFLSRAVLDPAQSVTVDEMIATLSAGATRTITAIGAPGGNCFDPDCTVTVNVDPLNSVPECREDNNRGGGSSPG